MSQKQPFPIVKGGCSCSLIRYQLNTSPLFCYACHCAECQKNSGSVFSVACTLEFDAISILSPTPPTYHIIKEKVHTRTIATCPYCKNVLWEQMSYIPCTLNVHVGTLDLPGLMEPDMHIFTQGKVHWVQLPEGARWSEGDMDRTKDWPRSSLVRLEACMARWEATQAKLKGEVKVEGEKEKEKEKERGEEGENGQEEKTPTNGSPEPKAKGGEDVGDDQDVEGDEEFEKRADGIEKALEERLEKLSLKLSNQEK